MKNDDRAKFSCLITTGNATDDSIQASTDLIIDACLLAARHNVGYVQIREKQLSSRNLLYLTECVVAAIKNYKTTVIVNSRPDIAIASGAGGVQLTDRSISIEQTRAAFGDRLLIGKSTHSLDDVIRARDAGADLVIFGPIFRTPDKGDPKGTVELASVCAASGNLPVLAVGGIDAGNLSAVFEAGASGVAAIRSMHEEKFLTKLASL